MQVILLEKINHLGNLGDIVKVKDGYARNYLIPTKRAKRATDAAIAESLVVGRKHALVALVVADYETAKKDGINENELQKVLEDSIFALNAKLPAYSQIGRCELRREQFEKTPKLSIKRFMYN